MARIPLPRDEPEPAIELLPMTLLSIRELNVPPVEAEEVPTTIACPEPPLPEVALRVWLMTVLLTKRHVKVLALNWPHCKAMLLSSKLLFCTVKVAMLEVFSELMSTPFEKFFRNMLFETDAVVMAAVFWVFRLKPLPPAGDTGMLD